MMMDESLEMLIHMVETCCNDGNGIGIVVIVYVHACCFGVEARAGDDGYKRSLQQSAALLSCRVICISVGYW
jgi:hypothetical protein